MNNNIENNGTKSLPLLVRTKDNLNFIDYLNASKRRKKSDNNALVNHTLTII